jgi:pimeloyl-ACP methyl ester carboxylesterase
MKQILIKSIGFYLNCLSFFSPKYVAKKALLLFSTPRKGNITKSQYDFLNSAIKEILLYGNLKIMTYNWEGNKETVLLSHGWESNAARWKTLIEPLQKLNYNIIAIDAPAHGDSEGKQFNALQYSECINIVVKKFNPSIFVGYSVGAMATVLYYHNYKFANIKKLILLGMPSEMKNIFKRYVNMMGYNKRIEKQINEMVFERFGNYPKYFSLAKFLKKATFSGLIIHDEKDPVIPYNEAISIKESFKNSQLKTTQHLGHSLNSREVTTHIVDFINR